MLNLPSEKLQELKGHTGPVLAVRFNGDGHYCISCGQDRMLRLWNPVKVLLLPPSPSLSPPLLPLTRCRTPSLSRTNARTRTILAPTPVPGTLPSKHSQGRMHATSASFFFSSEATQSTTPKPQTAGCFNQDVHRARAGGARRGHRVGQ